MNILIFIHSLGSGGAERVAANLANHWSSLGWQVTLVSIADDAEDFYHLLPSVRRYTLNLAEESRGGVAAVLHNVNRVIALRRVLQRLRPDVAVALMTEANVLLALATLGMQDVKTVGSERVHPPLAPLGTIWRGLRWLLYCQLDAIAALTRESADWLRRHTFARRIVVIPNTAPWPLRTSAPNVPLPMQIGQHHYLLAVGRLCDQKGFDLLINAFHHLAADFPKWRLVILGEGANRESLAMQIDLAGLVDRVYMPGRAGNVGQWYVFADIYVLSSRFEGFPNTLVEAMAHGLPAVSFDCDTGPRDIIRHDVDGLLVPPGDLAAFETALRRLMENDSLRERFGARAIEARERFSIQKISGMWEALFHELSHGR